jgi:hypothetical protein
MPCSIGWLQILWLLANPLWTHGIGESGSKTITGWLLMGAADANQIWWLNTNPNTGLLPHLNSYRIRHLPFGFLNMHFFFLLIKYAKKHKRPIEHKVHYKIWNWQ